MVEATPQKVHEDEEDANVSAIENELLEMENFLSESFGSVAHPVLEPSAPTTSRAPPKAKYTTSTPEVPPPTKRRTETQVVASPNKKPKHEAIAKQDLSDSKTKKDWPIKCDECGKSFSHPTILKMHINKFHS